MELLISDLFLIYAGLCPSDISSDIFSISEIELYATSSHSMALFSSLSLKSLPRRSLHRSL